MVDGYTEEVIKNVERVNRINEEIARRDPEGTENRRKVLAQPFITNQKLDNLLGSKTPKWVNYLMLILVALSLGFSFWALLHTYGII